MMSCISLKVVKLLCVSACFTQILPYQMYCLIDPDTKVGTVCIGSVVVVYSVYSYDVGRKEIFLCLSTGLDGTLGCNEGIDLI